MLTLYDANHVKVAYLPFAKDTAVSKEIATETISFSYPILSEQYALIQEEGYIRTADAEYVIKETEEDEDWAQVKGILNLEDFNTMYPSTLSFNGQTLTAVFQWLCNNNLGTWTLKVCELTDVVSIDPLVNPKLCDIIKTLSDMYNFEVEYDTINKTLSVLRQRGSDKGVFFSDKLNLRKLGIQRNSNGFITQLFPIGKNGAYIPPTADNKVFLENYQYSTKKIYAVWQDNRYTNMENMKQVAISRLDQLSKPVSAYTADVIDLAMISDIYKDVLDYNIGDTITLNSQSKGIKETQRIVKLVRYPDEPEKNTVELSNRTAILEDMQIKTLDASDIVEKSVDVNGNILGSTVATQTSPIASPDATAISISSSKIEIIYDGVQPTIINLTRDASNKIIALTNSQTGKTTNIIRT